jgi:hypothetical protein
MENVKLQIEINKLKSENEKMRECVAYYADRSNWYGRNSRSYPIISKFDRDCDNGIFYGGYLARKTLEELNR